MTAVRFTQQDLKAFAEFSGDHNPIHVDPVVARRLLFGTSIVHGVYALLWALDELAGLRPEGGRVTQLRAKFQKPIPVGATVRMRVLRCNGDEASVRLELDGVRAATIAARFGGAGGVGADVPDGRPEVTEPRELSVAAAAEAVGSVMPCLDRELSADLFPRLAEVLAPEHIAGLLATTRVVGMECPGLHSIYAELSCELEPAAAPSPLTYRVADHDVRFARIGMEIAGSGLRGTVVAFFRPQPRTQVALADVDVVESQEFAGQRAMILGGSRGLGEVAAKLLAAGGASLAVTHCHGEREARALVEEIESFGGEATSLHWNVLDDPPDLRSSLGAAWIPTHMYYFASPHIGATAGFSCELFSKFCDYYVAGFVRSVRALLDSGVERLNVLYPSSVFVEERPSDMSEYVAAKCAGEVVCDALQRQHTNLCILAPRLPRMATDQTQSLLGDESADPLPVMLGALRRLQNP